MAKLTQARLHELLKYDPATGVFTRRVSRRGHKAGERAGSLDEGYWCIQIEGKNYRAGRLAWFYVYGVWPAGQIDHENTDSSDDRWINLREATQTQNHANRRVGKNSHVGLKGVGKHGNKWRARIRVNGKAVYLGVFITKEAAHAAYCKAAKRVFGKFFRS